ncbi:MAG: DUF6148 family protein [Gammaproteobacteria bacterium]|nr:DUF6148 family protein [Gammaproteobacteria bacterium]
MSVTTGVSSQADAQARLQVWLDAEEAVASGQAYAIGSRSLTRANLADIRAQITYWQGQVRAFQAVALGAGSPGIRTVKWVG